MAQGGGRWERETTPPLGLRHLRQPGALQGHHREPGATRSARPGGEQRGIGTALPTTGRAAHPTRSQERQARVSAASEDPTPTGENRGKVESGRSPHPQHPPPHPPRQRVAEEEERGTRGQSERSGPIRHECPSIVRRGLDPAQENATSPHRSARNMPKEAPRGGNAQRGHRPEGPAFGLASTPRTQGKSSRATQGECLTRGTEPCRMERGGGVNHGCSRVPTAWSARGKGPTPPAHASLGCWRPEVAPQPGPPGGTRAGAQAHADGSNKRGPSRIWHHSQAKPRAPHAPRGPHL